MTDEAPATVDSAPINVESLKLLTVDSLINSYIDIKTGLEKLSREFTAKEAVRKERLALISIALNEKAKEMGVTQFKINGVATAYQQENTRSNCADWNVLGTFLYARAKEAEAAGRDPVEWITQFFEKRLNQGSIDTFIKTSETKEPPPGVNISKEIVMVVRRAPKK